MATLVKNTRPFDPRSISGCQLWLDAADSSTVTLSGANVTQWRDKSGNNQNAIQNVEGRYPSYTNSAIQTSVSGTSMFVSNFTATFPNTVVMVSRRILSDGIGAVIEWGANINSFPGLIVSPRNFDFYGERSASVWQQFYDDQSGRGVITYNTEGITYMYITSLTPTLRVNGSEIRTGYSVNTGSPTGSLTSQLNIGSRDQSSLFATVQYFEIIIYNGNLTTSQNQQVEGYLAWKWGLTSSLPATHPFKNPIVPFPHPSIAIRPKKSVLPYFDPRTISGCQLWLDAADPNGNGTVPANNANVSTWTDKSGNGNNMTVIAGTPKYIIDGARPTVVSFASGDILRTSTTFSFNTTATNVFIVYKYGTASGGLSMMLVFPDYQNVGYGSLGDFSIRGNGSGNIQLSGDINDAGNNIYVVNGTSMAVGNAYGYNLVNTQIITSGSSKLQLSSSFGSRFYIGTIAEVIYYNNASMTASQRQQLQGYLMWKWGIQSSLPSNHPYLQVPPNSFQLTVPRRVGFFKINEPINLSGGSKISAGGFTYHLFTTSGTLTTTKGGTVNYLIVGGGGGGGDRHGGGGGAGGVLSGTFTASGTYTITVGDGGQYGSTDEGGQTPFGTPNGCGTKGGNSSISGVATANGGGGGGSFDGNPTGTVGSGGGGGGNNLAGVAGTSGQGNSGGSGAQPGGGGGGGAGGAGSSANTSTGGIGTSAYSSHLLNVGYGTSFATSPQSPISGGVAYIAGGGGGAAASSTNPTARLGGLGGGGTGDWDNAVITAGTSNTGGGGGASRSNNVATTGRNGGSGLVLVWY